MNLISEFWDSMYKHINSILNIKISKQFSFKKMLGFQNKIDDKYFLLYFKMAKLYLFV